MKTTDILPRKKPKKGWPKSHTYAQDAKKEYGSDQMKGRDVDVKA